MDLEKFHQHIPANRHTFLQVEKQTRNQEFLRAGYQGTSINIIYNMRKKGLTGKTIWFLLLEAL